MVTKKNMYNEKPIIREVEPDDKNFLKKIGEVKITGIGQENVYFSKPKCDFYMKTNHNNMDNYDRLIGKNIQAEDIYNEINKKKPYFDEIGSKVLFVDEKGKDITELDYVIYFLKNNYISKERIEAIKKGNKKVLGSIPKNVWIKGLKEVEK
jgi:hypothetical protein